MIKINKIISLIIIAAISSPYVLFAASRLAPTGSIEAGLVGAVKVNLSRLFIPEEDPQTVDQDESYRNYVGGGWMMDAIRRMPGSTDIGMKYLEYRIKNPFKDVHDVKHVYKVQEDLLKDPELLDEINRALGKMDALITKAKDNLKRRPFDRQDYEEKVNSNTKILIPHTGELPKFLPELKQILSSLDNPEADRILQTLDRAMLVYNQVFTKKDAIFRRARLTFESDLDRIRWALKVHAEFLDILENSLQFIAGQCILANLRRNKDYKPASFGQGGTILEITDATNPFLNIKEDFVPLSLKIDKYSKVTVFSGLNTGGKSVMMRTMGIMALMVQTGMPVPADVYMDEGMFSSFLKPTVRTSDMGDKDSRFGGELKASQRSTAQAMERSLVIIDDDIFGASTEPTVAASCFCSMVEEYKAKGAVVTAVSHHLRGIEVLKDKNPDIRFLQVKVKPTTQGTYLSTREFEPGIAASSHGIQEAKRTGWSATGSAVDYYNLLAAQYGIKKLSQSGKRKQTGTKPAKHRGYFFSKAEQECIDIYNYIHYLMAERRERDELYSKIRNPEDDLKSICYGFIRNMLSKPNEVDRDKWYQALEYFQAYPDILQKVYEVLISNVKVNEQFLPDLDRRDVAMLIVQAKMQMRESGKNWENFNELLTFCISNEIPLLKEFASDINKLLETAGGKIFIGRLKEEGLLETTTYMYDRTEQLENIRVIIKNIFSICTLCWLGHLLVEEEVSLPDIAEGNGVIEIDSGLHTSLRHKPKKSPHTIRITSQEKEGSLTIYTGFNTGGKSFVAKTIAQIAVLAKMGWPVPAEYANISDFSDIQVLSPEYIEYARDHSRRRRIERGALEEALFRSNLIIQSATKKSLIILDEPFSGCTEPTVAAALTAALAEELTRKGATVILVTHHLDVVPYLEKAVPYAKCFKAETEEVDGITLPKYKFEKGIATSSHGLEVARSREWFGYKRASEYFDLLTEEEDEGLPEAGQPDKPEKETQTGESL